MVHNLTTIDAPETIAYIKSIPSVIINKARYKNGEHKTMWNLIPNKKMPPTRIARYCCAELKEQGGKGRVKITGVRWSESQNRKQNSDLVKIIGKPKSTQKLAKEIGAEYTVTRQNGLIMNDDNDLSRRMVEQCYRTTSTLINPIIDWSDDDVWEFLTFYGCKSNPLYQCGRKRIGCIGCPMQNSKGMIRDFAKYPKYKNNYIRAFDQMLKRIAEHSTWKTGIDVYKWWVGIDLNQLTLIDIV